MLQLRLSRFCSLQPFPILQGTYKPKWNKVVGFHTLHTVKMDLTKNQLQQNQQPLLYQNVIVMRHGERMDNFDPLWSSTAARPWDPPLAPPGLIQSFEMGRMIQMDIGFPIHRIVVSPFLRCIQTAAELVAGLFAADDSHDPFYDVSIDPSKVKVSIEYGLCEMMNSIAIRLNVFPKDGIFSFDITEREAMLPPETVDNNVEMLYKELPKWEEPKLEARARYEQTIKDLADKYPTQNLLFVTHAEGVQVARSSIKMDVVYKKVQYCGYVELRRPVYEKDHSFTCGDFDTLTQSGETGVSNISSQGL